MLVSIIGAIGSGKTLLCSILASKSKRDVYSNFWLDYPNYHPLEVANLLKLPDNIDVFIDEGYAWLESRTSGAVLNRYLSYIILQSRKRTIDIYVTAQMFSTIDNRFREQSNIIVKCDRINNGRDREYWDFNYEFLEMSSETIKRFLLRYDKAKLFFDKFNTYEIVEPHTKDVLEMKLLENNPKELFERVKDIGEEIKEYTKKISHDIVKNYLMKLGYPLHLEKYVYAYLKSE